MEPGHGLPTLGQGGLRHSFSDHHGIESQLSSICRGTRQGCPLLSILFILTLEPLKFIITLILGVLKLLEFTIRLLFVDDILVYFTSSHISLPILMELISNFATLSGCEVYRCDHHSLLSFSQFMPSSYFSSILPSHI